MFIVLLTKRLVAAAKFLVAATKKLFVVPNFVAVTKPFFSVWFRLTYYLSLIRIMIAEKNIPLKSLQCIIIDLKTAKNYLKKQM